MGRNELEVLLKKYPAGPFVSDGGFGVILGSMAGGHNSYDWPQGTQVEQLNRAYQIGRWVGRTEDQPPSPPLTDDTLYQPICKFCNQKVDEMVTVHFKHSDQKMCVECMHNKAHRNV
jgi:hypothetical protein